MTGPRPQMLPPWLQHLLSWSQSRGDVAGISADRRPPELWSPEASAARVVAPASAVVSPDALPAAPRQRSLEHRIMHGPLVPSAEGTQSPLGSRIENFSTAKPPTIDDVITGLTGIRKGLGPNPTWEDRGWQALNLGLMFAPEMLHGLRGARGAAEAVPAVEAASHTPDWSVLSSAARGEAPAVGALNLEVPTFMREAYKAPRSTPDFANMDLPTFLRRGSNDPMAFTPPLEASAAAPGVIDAHASRIAQRLTENVSPAAEATYQGLLDRRAQRMLPPGYTGPLRRGGDAGSLQAAIKLPDGRTFTGPTHFHAMLEAANAGAVPGWEQHMIEGVPPDISEGFIPPGAPEQFLSRQEAETRMGLPPTEAGLGSEDLLGGTGLFGLNERGAVPWTTEPGQRLFSRTELALTKAPFEKGTPQQWLAYLDRAPGGTFREEVERSGVKQMLEQAASPQLDLMHSGQRTFTKDEMLQQLRENPLQIAETQGTGRYRDYTLPGGENYREIVLHAPRGAVGFGNDVTIRRLQEQLHEIVGPGHAGEVLDIANPDRTTRHAAMRAIEDIPGVAPLAERLEAAHLQQQSAAYTSGHWANVENPIVHVRLTDREVAGKPSTFIEEIQSDVHQAGRESGYRDAEVAARARAEERAANDQHRALVQYYGTAIDRELKVSEASVHSVAVGGPAPGAILRLGGVKIGELVPHPNGTYYFEGAGSMRSWSTHETNIHAARNAVAEYITDPSRPDRVFGTLQELHNQAPLNATLPEGLTHPGGESSKTPVEYAFGAMNRLSTAEQRATAAGNAVRAAEEGVPKLPFSRTEDWTRLAIRRALDEAVQNGHTQLAWTTGIQQANRYSLAKHVDEIRYNPKEKFLMAYKNGNRLIHESDVTPEKLSGFVGKELADKLLAQPLADNGAHSLQGAGLTVGGGGMKSYYDNMLPKMMKEEFRKQGVKVEPKLTENAAGAAELTDKDIRTLARENNNEVLSQMYEDAPQGHVDPDDFQQMLDDAEERVRDTKADELANDWEPEKFDRDAAVSDVEDRVDEDWTNGFTEKVFTDRRGGHPDGRGWTLESLNDLDLQHEPADFRDAVVRTLEHDYDHAPDEVIPDHVMREAYQDTRKAYIESDLESYEEMWNDEHKNDEPPYDDFSEQASEYAGNERREAERLLDTDLTRGPAQVWTVDIPPELAAKVKEKGQPLGAAKGPAILGLTAAVAAGGVTAAALMQGKQNPETTQLAPKDEPRFRAWVKRYNIRDLDHPKSHYDYRGAFLAGAKPDAKGHWPDTFKQHGHESFSVQSKYSRGPQDGGRWQGNTYIPQTDAKKDSLMRRIRGY